MKNSRILAKTLQELLESHNEWLLTFESKNPFCLRNTEIEIEDKSTKTLISFLSDSGFETWRILKSKIRNEKIDFDLTRNFGKEETKIELIPRSRAEEFKEAVEMARLERVNKIRHLLIGEFKNTKLIRVELNKENGRFGQIVIEDKLGVQTAILSDVSGSLTPEVLLSSALLWLRKLERRKKNPINAIWILSEKRTAKSLQALHACMRKGLKNRILIKEISTKNAKKPKKAGILESKVLKIGDLWRNKPAKLYSNKNHLTSKISDEIIKLAPNKIDRIYSKNGETLRYLGLPFLRTRSISGEEKTWFGIDRKRRILRKNSYEDFYEFFENIKKYRTFDSPNKQHVFFQTAPEAWLESILRNNIKLLDSNLILSPIYNQFRTSRDKIDLLALRKDGQLVIIELKVTADREMLFQAVDYWRKLELQRRKGMLGKAFGSKEIADKPTIVYLVSPTFSYHYDFDFLSTTISDEIEIFRFDLAENWRENIKVLSRKRIG